MKHRLITATATIKILAPTKEFPKLLDTNKNATLVQVKPYLKPVLRIMKNHSTSFNIKNDTELSKELRKIKRPVEHQKLYGKQSKYAVPTIQTVSAAFYV